MSINVAPYTTSYYRALTNEARWDTDGFHIAEAIHELFAPESAADFGCGTGRVLKALFHGFDCKDIYGIEGSKDALDFIDPTIREFVEQGDVTEPVTLPKDSYDVVICTEVAEHIYTKDSEALVRNLCATSNVVVFSAAPPGQGGAGHINCQPWSYWEKLFLARRFHVDQKATEKYKNMLKQAGTKEIYVRNGMILKK